MEEESSGVTSVLESIASDHLFGGRVAGAETQETEGSVELQRALTQEPAIFLGETCCSLVSWASPCPVFPCRGLSGLGSLDLLPCPGWFLSVFFGCFWLWASRSLFCWRAPTRVPAFAGIPLSMHFWSSTSCSSSTFLTLQRLTSTSSPRSPVTLAMTSTWLFYVTTAILTMFNKTWVAIFAICQQRWRSVRACCYVDQLGWIA